MTTDFHISDPFHWGMPYDVFLQKMRQKVEAGGDGLDEAERKLFGYVRLNYQRSQRIHRTYKVSDDLRALIAKITEPQRWLVLTEDWCGDSAQTIPYVAEMAVLNPNVELRILQRDDNLDIMDQYLTDGKRSIPIVAAFDHRGYELFHWGPRPAEAAALFQAEQEAGLPKAGVYKKLHLWYGRDRGQAVEAEFKALLAQPLARAA